MTNLRSANTLKTACIAALAALTMACGYSAKATPPTAGTTPAISALNPESATSGGAAFTLTVNGSNFGSKAVVNWNGTAQTATTYITGNQLTVAIPASLIMNSGSVEITVTNPATSGTGIYGTGATAAATSSPMTFTVN
jgi:hypothetical protein